jgi:hypothetical protein
MLRELGRMHADGLIDAAELQVARDAQLGSPWKHTIGYEVEVFPSAVPDIPEAQTLHNQIYSINGSCVQPYGYTVGSDAYYELSSPHAQHAYPLEVATLGLARGGYLPIDSEGFVGSHVSIGTTAIVDDPAAGSLLRALRLVEMAGGTYAMRLSAPLRRANELRLASIDTVSWGRKGELGLSINHDPTLFAGRSTDSTTTAKTRIEFRTLSYMNPEQFGGTLELLHLLSRGILSARHTSAHRAWEELEDWLTHDSGLPDYPFDWTTTRVSTVEPYLSPYIERIASGETDDIMNIVNQAASTIAESLGVKRRAEILSV